MTCCSERQLPHQGLTVTTLLLLLLLLLLAWLCAHELPQPLPCHVTWRQPDWCCCWHWLLGCHA
jgi:hypothetical protein